MKRFKLQSLILLTSLCLTSSSFGNVRLNLAPFMRSLIFYTSHTRGQRAPVAPPQSLISNPTLNDPLDHEYLTSMCHLTDFERLHSKEDTFIPQGLVTEMRSRLKELRMIYEALGLLDWNRPIHQKYLTYHSEAMSQYLHQLEKLFSRFDKSKQFDTLFLPEFIEIFQKMTYEYTSFVGRSRHYPKLYKETVEKKNNFGKMLEPMLKRKFADRFSEQKLDSVLRLNALFQRTITALPSLQLILQDLEKISGRASKRTDLDLRVLPHAQEFHQGIGHLNNNVKRILREYNDRTGEIIWSNQGPSFSIQ